MYLSSDVFLIRNVILFPGVSSFPVLVFPIFGSVFNSFNSPGIIVAISYILSS